jgi:dipeptidyl aminopeptidase/acylaminoacyl peptidase
MDLFRLVLAQNTVRQITFGMLGGIPEDVFVEPELIQYQTFDGRDISAFLYKPRVAEGGQVPAVLAIHGGPEAQERPEYRYGGLYQYLVYRGIAVLAPNIRGSNGYGKTFQKLIHHDWGGDDLKDMEAAAQYLLAQDWVDPERIGVFGGSYGGFATLSCVTRLPDYWAAGAELVGPSNLVTFASSVPPTWRRMVDKWVGNPETEREFLLERSPITYVDQIRCPLLVMQGANDYRVVKAESDQMVERIRARGGTVEYVVFPDEGHGFTRRSNLLKAYRTTAEFFLERFGLSNVVPGEPVESPMAAARA